jgi:hypothetical protein
VLDAACTSPILHLQALVHMSYDVSAWWAEGLKLAHDNNDLISDKDDTALEPADLMETLLASTNDNLHSVLGQADELEPDHNLIIPEPDEVGCGKQRKIENRRYT